MLTQMELVTQMEMYTTTDDTDGTEGEGNAATDDTGDRSMSQILVERITRDVLNQ